jgi:hypothetical protein
MKSYPKKAGKIKKIHPPIKNISRDPYDTIVGIPASIFAAIFYMYTCVIPAVSCFGLSTSKLL